jgi:hypothetical protein
VYPSTKRVKVRDIEKNMEFDENRENVVLFVKGKLFSA